MILDRKSGGRGAKRRKLKGAVTKVFNAKIRMESYQQLLALAGSDSLALALERAIDTATRSEETAKTP